MTKKDFVAMALIVKNSGLSPDARIKLAETMAASCASKNSRFDYDRFFRACGLEQLCEVD